MWKKYLIQFAITTASFVVLDIVKDVFDKNIDEVALKVNKNIYQIKKKEPQEV